MTVFVLYNTDGALSPVVGVYPSLQGAQDHLSQIKRPWTWEVSWEQRDPHNWRAKLVGAGGYWNYGVTAVEMVLPS